MSDRTVHLVLQYDGSRFAGWQRQPNQRTVQGELERVLERLFGSHTTLTGAGRTDAGVHARGQSAHVKVTGRWDPGALRRAMNALLPGDVWIESARLVTDDFHARYSATARRYTYYVGTDDGADSPFRRAYEWHIRWPVDADALQEAAAAVRGDHQFYGFAVRGTAPSHDDHRCTVTRAEWRTRPGGLEFVVEANRFLHHMVRFLVGTMVDVAAGRRPVSSFLALLAASDNLEVSAPAPPHALFLDHVTYPPHFHHEPT